MQKDPTDPKVYHAFYHGGIVRSPDEKLSLRFRGIQDTGDNL